MAKIIIEEQSYEVKDNLTIYEACRQAGIILPALMYDDRLEPVASCDLSVVEVEGEKKLVNACTQRISDGMKIQTQTARVREARKKVLTDLLAKHPLDCEQCSTAVQCKLQAYVQEYEIPHPTQKSSNKNYELDESNPFYIINPNKCLACELCVRVCSELQGVGALEINDKGYVQRKLTVECESCGNCIDICPVRAIIPKRFAEEYAQELAVMGKEQASEQTRHVKTTCSYCGVGCQLELVVLNEKVIDVKPVKVPPNNGLLCVKGKFGHKFINHPTRLKTPLIRKNGKLVEADWDEAYDLITKKVKEIKSKYGSDALAGLSSARYTNEENYLFQKLVRTVFGTNNVDHCARL